MSALVDHLWQSTLFGGAIWLVALALRNNPASIRHALWLLASLKFLIPFSALYTLGAAAGLSPPVESQSTLLALASNAAVAVIAPARAGYDVGAAPYLLITTLLTVWAMGSAAIAISWWRAWRYTRDLSIVARPAPDFAADVRITDADIEPSVVRVKQPVVLLPAALLARLPKAQLDAVLAHEREHIARHDNLKAHIHQLVIALFWFHPLVWYIGRQLLEERERACDEAVIEAGHGADDYAAGILAVCRHCRSAQAAHALAPRAMAAASGDLTTRVRHILAERTPPGLGFLKAFSLSVCSFVVAAVPVGVGALDDAVARRERLTSTTQTLSQAGAQVRISTVDGPARIDARGREIDIRHSSLRELLALAYGVELSQVRGSSSVLDAPRYDIRLESPAPIGEADDFEPAMLSGVVAKLLASHFDLEIHVNQRCQDPCGRRALAARPNARR